MNFRRPGRRSRYGIDLTPMIDVVLQLIIFFMYTSQFSRMMRTELDLPRQRGEESRAAPAQPVVVDVTPTGAYVVDGREVGLDRLAGMIGAEAAQLDGGAAALDLLVRADRACPSAAINRLAERLAVMGVRAWRLGTADPGGGS